jgi:hypothetical protein
VSQQINLFNPALLKQKKLFAALAMAQALGLLLAGIVAVSYYGERSVAALQREASAGSELLLKKQASLAVASTEFVPRQKSKELEARIAEADARLHALRQVSAVLDGGELGNTGGYSKYFKALARQHMEGLWLTGVSIAGAGNEIGVQGRALQASLVPGYIGRLTREPVLQGKAFGSLQISQAEPKKAPDKDGTRASEPAPYVEFSLQSASREVDK